MLVSRSLPRFTLRSFLKSYTCRVFLIFLIIYALSVYYARIHCWRDPTSFFFRDDEAYEPVYSDSRTEQANLFIESANNRTGVQQSKASHQPSMCVGFASVARNGVSYFESAVGSVLAGLSEAERADLYLILFIAHTDPTEHPAYSEPWLQALADKVLLYDKEEVDVDHIRSLETAEAKSFAREKGLFDYTYLLKACQSVNAPYNVILEDDIVALDGWFHRTKQAIVAAERQTREQGAAKWLYLRLFYTEQFLGWNSEEWPFYLFYSLLSISAVVATTLTIRRYTPSSRPFLPNETILVMSFICTPLLIVLFFAAGRVTMLPISKGVHDMPKFGCCSQGFIFPQTRIPDLVSWYESKHVGYVDMLTEEYADQHGEIRWALTPSVLQHVGSKSSKFYNPIKNGGHRTVSQTLWNFAFEENDVNKLHREHERAWERSYRDVA